MIERIFKTKNKDVKFFKMKKFKDKRGYFEEIYNEDEFRKKLKISFKSKLICTSFSKKNVLRGFHYQQPRALDQIVYVKKGKILDVVVDLRKKSKFYGKYEKFVLSEFNQKMIYMPKGFAHAFYALEKENLLVYNMSGLFNKKFDRGIRWNDPVINFPWPSKNPILSKKDKNHPILNEIRV